MPLSEPVASPSWYAIDDYEQRIKNLEDLLDREQREAQNFIVDVKEWNERELEEKMKVIEAL
jgi:hypothetical protein